MTENTAEKYDQTEASAEVDVPVLKSSVGEQLRAARENAGLKLIDVSQVLKLGVRQLQALEDGDWHLLPGPTFVRGFVRSYARLVSLDPARLMTELDMVLSKPASVLDVPESSPANIPYRPSASGHGGRSFVFLGLFAVFSAVIAYFLLPSDLYALREEAQAFVNSLSRVEAPQTAAPLPKATSISPVVSEPVFPPGVTPQQVLTPQSITPVESLPVTLPAKPVSPPEKATLPLDSLLSFEVVRESWIEVKDRDDKIVFSKKMTAGSQQEVTAKAPLSLVIGYAPGVKLQWQGKSVDLEPYSRGEVARLVLE